jgi:hypothetical protein
MGPQSLCMGTNSFSECGELRMGPHANNVNMEFLSALKMNIASCLTHTRNEFFINLIFI